jgi:hypothetical protein
LGQCDGRAAFLRGQAPGLLGVLRDQIVPRLKAEVPNQPTLEQLEAEPLLSRFTIVFDREGYSPNFFAQMKEERIAILTYHKFPGERWSEQEFREHQVRLVNGEEVAMKLSFSKKNIIFPGSLYRCKKKPIHDLCPPPKSTLKSSLNHLPLQPIRRGARISSLFRFPDHRSKVTERNIKRRKSRSTN